MNETILRIPGKIPGLAVRGRQAGMWNRDCTEDFLRNVFQRFGRKQDMLCYYFTMEYVTSDKFVGFPTG